MAKDELAYLGQPYTGPLAKRAARYRAGLEASANCFKAGYFVFSPIVHCHMMHELCGLPQEFSFWEDYDRLMLKRCQQLWILPLEGWRNSVGLAAEIQIAGGLRHPIKVIVEHDERRIELISYAAAVRDTAAFP